MPASIGPTLHPPLLAAIAFLTAGSWACTPATPEAELTEEGVSWALAEHRRATIQDLEYQLALVVPEIREEPIQGRILARFRWMDEERRPLVFDFLEPERRVASVFLNERPVPFRPVNDHVLIPIPEDVSPGPMAVRIEFTAGDESLNRNPEFLYALFVPERARYAIPLFDQPNLKAPFSVALDLPRDWSATANGRQIREEAEGERRRFRFAPSEPLPSYLFSFAAGRFQKETRRVGDRYMEFFHRETDRERVERNVEEIFRLHAAALDWLEAYTGIPYPFQKMGFVAIPAFQYGGMEHPGAIFYRDSRLFLDERATQSDHLGRASLIAHETAHMWFGDLVTMHWFDDVWTKEVFANFMAAKIVHPSFPELNHDLRFLLAHHPAAYDVDRTEGANSIRQPLENLREAGSLYGAIIYQKAPIVMRQLEILVGGDTFREGVREYLERHAFGNATWPDLIDILDQRSPEALSSWSQVWVEEAGRPAVWAEWEEDSSGRVGSLVLRQADPAGRGRMWPQPLSLALGYGGEVEKIPVRLTEPEMTVPQGQGRDLPDFVLPDGWGVGYGHFRLDPASFAFLLENLPGVRDPVVRGAGWLALWDAVLEGEAPSNAFLDLLLAAIPREEEEQILQWILHALDTTFWNLISPSVRRARGSEVEEVLWMEMGREPGPSRTTALFRTYRSVALTSRALVRLEALWRGEEGPSGLPLSESDRTDLAAALALREVEGWEEILDDQLVSIRNPDRRAEFEFVRRALDPDPEVREAFFQDLKIPRNREKEPWVLAGLSYLHHPLRREHALRFILPSLELLEEIQRTGDIFFPARWMSATLGHHTAPEAAETVRDFLRSRPGYPHQLRLKILQAADLLFRTQNLPPSRTS